MPPPLSAVSITFYDLETWPFDPKTGSVHCYLVKLEAAEEFPGPVMYIGDCVRHQYSTARRRPISRPDDYRWVTAGWVKQQPTGHAAADKSRPHTEVNSRRPQQPVGSQCAHSTASLCRHSGHPQTSHTTGRTSVCLSQTPLHNFSTNLRSQEPRLQQQQKLMRIQRSSVFANQPGLD